MNLRDELSEEEAFVLEPGTPTITFCGDNREVMIPWISFRHATCEAGKIRLFFQGWLVELKGESLEILWVELQLQTVRSISQPISGLDHGSSINGISIEQL
jgi:hypothetical protein